MAVYQPQHLQTVSVMKIPITTDNSGSYRSSSITLSSLHSREMSGISSSQNSELQYSDIYNSDSASSVNMMEEGGGNTSADRGNNYCSSVRSFDETNSAVSFDRVDSDETFSKNEYKNSICTSNDDISAKHSYFEDNDDEHTVGCESSENECYDNDIDCVESR